MTGVFHPPQDPFLPSLGKAVKSSYIKKKFELAIGKILQRPGIVIRDIRIEYFHYKPQVNCRIVYRVLLETGEELVAWGKVTAPTQKVKKHKGKWFRFLPALHMTLRLLPSDKTLPGLKHVMSPKWLSHNRGYFLPYEKVKGAAFKTGAWRIDIVNYRPQYRCLLRINFDTDFVIPQEGRSRPFQYTFFAKVFSQPLPVGWVKVRESISAAAANSSLLVPPVTAYIEKKRILFSQAVPGNPLLETLARKDGKRLIKKVSRALRVLHSVPSELLDIRNPTRELADLESCVLTWQRIDTDLGALADRVLQGLYRQVFYLTKWDYGTGTVHGDFSHEQVLVKNGRILILDFDRLAIGDTGVDLGNFIANLIEARIAGTLEKTKAKAYIKTLVRSYHRIQNDSQDKALFRWHTAAALLKLAIRPLRRAEAGWKKRARKILAFALRMLNGDYDYLFPVRISEKLRQQPLPEKFHPLALQAELRNAEDEKTQLLPQAYAGRTLKKTWPLKSGSWLLLYTKNARGMGDQPVYVKLSAAGDKDFHAFPEDGLLKTLPDAVNPENIIKKLRAQAPDAYGLSDKMSIETVIIMSYKPEHRCQLEYQIITGMPEEPRIKLFAKVLRKSREAARLHAVASYYLRFLAESRGDIFPPHSQPFLIPELKAVVFPHIAGAGFNEMLEGKGPEPKVVENIAEGLFTFHSSAYDPPRTHFWEDEIQIMSQWTSQAVQLFPVIAGDASPLLERIIQQGNTLKHRVKVPVHRDFYDKQILVTGHLVTFLDYDSTALGNPALDVGNFIAHLKLRGIQKRGDPDHFNRLMKTFIKTYQKHSQRDDQGHITLYTAAALLRLAYVYLFRPGGWRFFYPLIQDAQKTINSI